MEGKEEDPIPRPEEVEEEEEREMPDEEEEESDAEEEEEKEVTPGDVVALDPDATVRRRSKEEEMMFHFDMI